MSDKANISSKSECDIDHQHDENLIRNRMVGRMEIDPEIGEECHTEARDSNSCTEWCKKPKTYSDKECIEEKECAIPHRRHTRLDLRTCLIEKIGIHEYMEQISVEKLVEKELSEGEDPSITRERNLLQSEKISYYRKREAYNRDNHRNENECMRKVFSRIEWDR